MGCCWCLRYLCPQTRTIDNVQVKDVPGQHALEHVAVTFGLSIICFVGVVLTLSASDTAMYAISFFLVLLPMACGALLWWANNRTFAEYKEATDNTEYSRENIPWYFAFVNDPVLRCDAIALLQHRLVHVQELLDATRTHMISTYKRSCPLYPIVRVNRVTLRAHLSTQLEYDLRTGKMFMDSIEAPTLNNSEAICQALLNDSGVSVSASVSLMHEAKGPTHVISDATEDAATELDELNGL